MGGDARRRPRPAGAAPRIITAGRSSTTEWKKKGGKRKKGEKKRTRRRERTCAQFLWIEKGSLERGDTDPH